MLCKRITEVETHLIKGGQDPLVYRRGDMYKETSQLRRNQPWEGLREELQKDGTARARPLSWEA